MKEALKCFGKNYGNFEGRASRKEYVCFHVLTIVLSILYAALLSFFNLKDKQMDAMFGLLTLYLLIPSVSLVVRRFHDIGKNGWSYFLLFVPVAGFIFALILLFKRGDSGLNRYGENPIEPKVVVA